MRYKAFFGVLTICCVMVCKYENPVSDSNKTAPADNSAPVIESVTFIPDTILAGESCLVKCTAFDPDDDDLSYEWETIGNIAGSGSSVFYTPNACCSSPAITVTVTDVWGKSTFSKITVPFKYE
jgi:hypothetical protein